MIFRTLLGLIAAVVLSACASGSGRQGTEVTVSASGPTAAVQAGSQVVFVMTVKNTGPDDASNVGVFDSVGNQLEFISMTCVAQGGATCPAAPSISMTIPTLPNGASLVFSVTLQLGANAQGTISNTMRASFAEEIDSSAATATATATVETAGAGATLVFGGTGPTQIVVGGSQAVFTMTVTNTGAAASDPFNLVDTLSNGLTLVSITCAASSGATCPTTVALQMASVPSLPAGGVLTFTVTTQVAQNVNGTLSNTLGNGNGNSYTVQINVASASLSVRGSGPVATIIDGGTGTFTIIVTNNGPGTAQNISIANAFSAGLMPSGTVGCMPANGAVCPTALGMTMTVPSLVNTGVLTFTVPFIVNGGTSGTMNDTVTVTSSSDPQGTRTATINVQTGNPNNGTFPLFAANGVQYSITINFDVGTYTITGNNQTIQETFTADPSGGGYTVSGNKRLRVASNLIVGGEDFGGGVVPYVAPTTVLSTVGPLTETYDLVSLELPSGGPKATYAATARVSGSTLQICPSASGVIPTQSCPSGSLDSYTLSISGGVFTATSTGSAPSFTFETGLAGSTTVILSNAAAADGNPSLLIGVPDSSGLAGGTTEGPANNGDYVTMTLTANSYSYTGQLGSDTAPLMPINSSGGPFAMLTGNRASDNAPIYVMQAYPLSVEIGAPGGNASGQLQVTVP